MSDRYRDEEDIDLDLDEGEPPRRRGRLLAVLIALFAIGGFGGVLWYAYSQGQRSADAVAPILRADGEPSRVRPEQPGGMVVPHQDKLVLNNMQQTARTGQVERLLPPAEAPLPQTTRTVPPPYASVTLPSSPTSPQVPPAAPPPATTVIPTPIPPPVPPVIAAPSIPVTPTPPPLPPPSGLVAPPAPPPVPPASSGTAAPAPTPSVPTIPPPPQVASRPPAATTPSPPRGGAWRVQLGSFPQPDQATTQGDRLKRSHGELRELDFTTVRVDLGSRGVWYRLQAGPLAEAAARQMCEDLKSKKQDCIIVRP